MNSERKSERTRNRSSRNSFASDIDDILATAAAVEAAVISAELPESTAHGSATGGLPRGRSDSATSHPFETIMESSNSKDRSVDSSVLPAIHSVPNADTTAADTALRSSPVSPAVPKQTRRSSSLPSRRQSASDIMYEAIPVIHEVETPITQCVCHEIISFNSVNCQKCQTTIMPLFEAKRERVQLLESLEAHKRELQNEETKHVLSLKENQRLQLRIKELEDHLDIKEDDLTTLRNDMHTLSSKLVSEVEKRAEIQAERDRISEELEELTRSLFEEANVMVADEAKRRHELEKDRDSIQTELQRARKKLERERSVIQQLNRRISVMSADSMLSKSRENEKSREASSLSKDISSSGIDKTTDDATNGGIATHLQIPRHDSFAVLDLDFLPDQRLFNDFMNSFEKLASFPLAKLFTSIPFLKQLTDDHVEPCLRLPKLSSRKLMDAMINGNLCIKEWKLAADQDEAAAAVDEKSTSQVKPPTPPSSSTGSSGNPSPEKLNTNTEPAATNVDESPSKPVKERQGTATGSRSPFWFSSSSSATTNSPMQCAGCAREVDCDYQIVVTVPNPTSSSSLSSSFSNKLDLGFASLNGLYVHTCCRERLQAACEFYFFFKLLKYVREEQDRRASKVEEDAASKAANEDQTEDRIERRSKSSASVESGTESLTDIQLFHNLDIDRINMRQVYVDFLRILKQLFYARIGVFSFFKRLHEHSEVQLDNIDT